MLNGQEFRIVPAGKIAVIAPVIVGLLMPMVILAVIALNTSTRDSWREVVPALLMLPVGGAVLAWGMRGMRLRLVDGVLRYGSFPWHRIALGELDLQAAEIVDLQVRPELQPVWKRSGAGLPGFRSGKFRLRNRMRAQVLLTDTRRVLALPTRGGGIFLFSAEKPEAVLQILRAAAASAQVALPGR